MNKIENKTLNKNYATGYYGYNEPKEYDVGFYPHKTGTYKLLLTVQSNLSPNFPPQSMH